jgi:hypothetical protein
MERWGCPQRSINVAPRQFDVGLISPFGPRGERPKWRKIVPRAERFFAPVEFTLHQSQKPEQICMVLLWTDGARSQILDNKAPATVYQSIGPAV